jgi:hypothetical protein
MNNEYSIVFKDCKSDKDFGLFGDLFLYGCYLYPSGEIHSYDKITFRSMNDISFSDTVERCCSWLRFSLLHDIIQLRSIDVVSGDNILFTVALKEKK